MKKISTGEKIDRATGIVENVVGITMKEVDFQRQVIDLAHYRGWLAVHFRASMNARGQWMTAVQGDGVGWPDLFLVRPPRLKLVELKLDGGKLTVAQQGWREVLILVPFLEYGLWTPSMWDEIVEDLR